MSYANKFDISEKNIKTLSNADLAAALNWHVDIRGGPGHENSAWYMMLEAAKRILELEEKI